MAGKTSTKAPRKSSARSTSKRDHGQTKTASKPRNRCKAPGCEAAVKEVATENKTVEQMCSNGHVQRLYD